MKKSELKQIIKEEIQKINEGFKQKAIIELEIEHDSKLDKAIIEFYIEFKNNLINLNIEKLIKNHQRKYPDLLIGKGGHHFWFKNKNNKDERLAIIKLP